MSNTLPGKLITIEGIECAGKSTALGTIKTYLTQHDIDFIVTREPGGTVLAEQIRQVLLTQTDEKLLPISELLLMFAARAQHIAAVIKPALAAGHVVICDRFTDASFAYQGGGRQLNMAWITQLEAWVAATAPDLTVLLDLPVPLSLERLRARGKLDRIEQSSPDFFERIRQTYLKRAHDFPERYRVVDAAQPLAMVETLLTTLLDGFFNG